MRIRRVALCVFALISMSVLVVAQGTLGVPFTAIQQQGLLDNLNVVNAQRAAQDPPLSALTLQAHGIAVCQAVFDEFAVTRAQVQESQALVLNTYLGRNTTYQFKDEDRTAVDAFIAACVSNSGCL